MLTAVLAGAKNSALVLDRFPVSPTLAPACSFGTELLDPGPELLFDPELLPFEAELLAVEPELPFDPEPQPQPPLEPVRPILLVHLECCTHGSRQQGFV